MPSKGESLSPWEHTAIGALAGFVEVCVMQPTVGVKNALQEGRSVPRNPAVLYRGLTVGWYCHSDSMTSALHAAAINPVLVLT
jgi:hypothetical protein